MKHNRLVRATAGEGERVSSLSHALDPVHRHPSMALLRCGATNQKRLFAFHVDFSLSLFRPSRNIAPCRQPSLRHAYMAGPRLLQ